MAMEGFGSHSLSRGLDDNQEFRSLGQALLQFMRVFTGETWGFLVESQLKGDGAAVALFAIYWVAVFMGGIHVFTSIAFAAYGEATRFVQLYNRRETLHGFRMAFLDEAGGDLEQPIAPDALRDVLAELPSPLGLPLDARKAHAMGHFTRYDVAVRATGVYYGDVVRAFILTEVGHDIGTATDGAGHGRVISSMARETEAAFTRGKSKSKGKR